jgi:L-amino acid N-acyltransferase YncA
MSFIIREFIDADISRVTDIWNEIIAEGKSFPWEKPLDIEYVQNVFSRQTEAYCACIDEELIGFYILHPNSVGREKHIANALYAVRREHRGQGIGKKLIIHSIDMAKKHRFIGMQYNSVVATNPSVNIYEKIGFEQIGVIKNGFKLDENNYVDLVIFYLQF